MRAILVAAVLLLSGCAAAPVRAPVAVPPPAPAPAPAPPRSIDLDRGSAFGAGGSVRIVPAHDASSMAKAMVLRLRAETEGLRPPLKFHWYLGNGHEWNGPEPPPQTYIVGRYDVILSVTDGIGVVRKASMKVDAESQGCSF